LPLQQLDQLLARREPSGSRQGDTAVLLPDWTRGPSAARSVPVDDREPSSRHFTTAPMANSSTPMVSQRFLLQQHALSPVAPLPVAPPLSPVAPPVAPPLSYLCRLPVRLYAFPWLFCPAGPTAACHAEVKITV
jgi:hypothetical protein